MSVIAPGTPVPQFRLTDAEREPFTQDSIAGRKVILAFFPYAFSSVCTDEFTLFERDARRRLEVAGVQLYGVSTDPVPAQSAFREKLEFSFELLSDFEPKGETARKFGAYFEPAGMTNRALVAIGDDGLVKWSWIGESPGDLPDPALITEALIALDPLFAGP